MASAVTILSDLFGVVDFASIATAAAGGRNETRQTTMYRPHGVFVGVTAAT